MILGQMRELGQESFSPFVLRMCVVSGEPRIGRCSKVVSLCVTLRHLAFPRAARFQAPWYDQW